VFVTSVTGRVQALDARTGCTIWTYEAGSGTRTAINVFPALIGGAPKLVAYFGDEAAMVHAVDARTGKLLWKVKVDDHPAARVTGALVWLGGRLIVPVASTEEVGATAPYSCCTFRGSVVALDGITGAQVWKTYTIPQTPKVYGKAKDGTPLMGPAGASVWSAPTVDTKLQRIYVGTSNSYSGAPTGSSDAIMAFDAKDGKLLWTNQVSAGDNFVVGCYVVKPAVCKFGICNGPGEGECPDKVGPDYDFGASPVLRALPDGKRMLVAGAKSAWVYGLDPDHGGKLVWKQKVGAGSAAGGIEWGMAADHVAVYAPTSDIYTGPPDQVGGLTALDIATGKVVWHAGPQAVCAWGKDNCWGALSQAVTVMPGLVFAGSMDGHLRAYDTKDGKVAWDFDAGGKFQTVNQGEQSGGSLNGGGPTIAGGMVFVNAGYGRFAGQNGHVLLAFGMQ
jgi:polyvinyl alcohol dehydrogenase (cytochrome)